MFSQLKPLFPLIEIPAVFMNGLNQFGQVAFIKLRHASEWMAANIKQHFVFHDIARACKNVLIQEKIAYVSIRLSCDEFENVTWIPHLRHQIDLTIQLIQKISAEPDRAGVEIDHPISKFQFQPRRAIRPRLIDAIASEHQKVSFRNDRWLAPSHGCKSEKEI